jgi:hypothetical protein
MCHVAVSLKHSHKRALGTHLLEGVDERLLGIVRRLPVSAQISEVVESTAVSESAKQLQ